MTLEEINKKIEELELKKKEIISEEKERLENEKKARKQKVDEAYDAFIKLREEYVKDYGTYSAVRRFGKNFSVTDVFADDFNDLMI